MANHFQSASPHSSTSGVASRGRGLVFQQLIDHTNAAYRRQGRAFITRKAIPGKYITPAPCRSRYTDCTGGSTPDTLRTGDVISAADFRQMFSDVTNRKRYIFVPESRAEPDYGGVVSPHGRAIVYDAKSTQRERLDFDNLHPHQVAFLENMAECGAIAGFLVDFVRYGSVFFIPIQMVTLIKFTTGRRNIPYVVCARHLPPVLSGPNGIIHDYLAAIVQQEQQYGTNYSLLQLTTSAVSKSVSPSATRKPRRVSE